MKASVIAVAPLLVLLLALQLLSSDAIRLVSALSDNGLLQVRSLSIANGKKPDATDDDDDDEVAEVTSTDDDDTTSTTKKKATASSPYSTASSTSTTEDETSAPEASATKAPAATKSKPTTNTTKAKPAASNNSTENTNAKKVGNTNSTKSSSNNTTATSTKKESNNVEDDGVSEWSFHNMTAADDLLYNVSVASKNATSILPREAEQTETWAITVLAIFTALAVILCTITAYRRRRKRHNYEEIESVVV